MTATVVTNITTTTAVCGVGRLNGILLVSAPGGNITAYDSTGRLSGVVIAYIPSTATIGSYMAYDIPYGNGITFKQETDSTTLTLVYTRG